MFVCICSIILLELHDQCLICICSVILLALHDQMFDLYLFGYSGGAT